MTGRWILLGAVFCALLQTGLFITMIEGRASILRNGQEVRLKTVPVDPRDLWRGRYVTLAYEISDVDAALFDLPAGDETTLKGDVFVRLETKPNGNVGVKRVYFENPSRHDPGTWLVRARIEHEVNISRLKPGRSIQLSYGIERFYVSEPDALRIEEDYRDRQIPVDVIAAFNRSGMMQIKQLLIDGQPAYEEPLY